MITMPHITLGDITFPIETADALPGIEAAVVCEGGDTSPSGVIG